MSKTDLTGLDQHQKDFIKLIRENARRHHLHEVFRDFCEMSALAFSNAVDLAQREPREARYLQIVCRYEPEEVKRFPVMLHHVVESLQGRFHDCLGQLFMALQLGDHWKGQFFTPYDLAYLMAKIGGASAPVDGKGFATLMEPACGAGCMVIAAAEAMHDDGINYQQCLHVTAIDIDQTAAHMAYIQLTLLHVPAIVVHGNALWPDKTWSNWVTPAHVLGGWDRKLAQADVAQASAGESPAPAAAELEISQNVDEVRAAVDLVKHRSEVVAARVGQLALF